MATVTGFTAARMKQIEDKTVVDGDVVGDNLVLKTRDGGTINAGNVRGPQGIQGIPGSIDVSPAGGDLTGNYPNPTIKSGAITEAKVAAAIKDGAANVPSLRTLGSNPQQAAKGDHTHPGLKDSGWQTFAPTAGNPPFGSQSVISRCQYRKIGSLVQLRFAKTNTASVDMSASNGNFGNLFVFGLNSIPETARPDVDVRGAGLWQDAPVTFAVNTSGAVILVGGMPRVYAANSAVILDILYMTDN